MPLTISATIRNAAATASADLVKRGFTASRPDELWVADITYVPTCAGFLFLAVVLDVCSRRVVGWAMANHMRKELVVDALDMAIFRRRPKAVVHPPITVLNTHPSLSANDAAKPA